MGGQRPEPYQVALAELRDRLRSGAYPPGARVVATDVADDLRLSATPIREALSRLAGEGLLEERRGQGFFVRLLTAADIADLYRLSLAYLLIAQDPHRPPPRRASPMPVEPPPEPVRYVERLFAAWMAETASRSLMTAFRMVQVQLGPVRRIEGLIIPDLAGEASELQALSDEAGRAGRLARLRAFHSRRLRLAEPLATRLAEADQPGQL